MLAGHGLELLPMQKEHAPSLWEAGQNPSLWTYMPFPMRSLEDMQAHVNEALKARDQGIMLPFVLRLTAPQFAPIQGKIASSPQFRDKIDASTPNSNVARFPGPLVGSTRFYDMSETHRRAEIGYTWIHPDWQRTFVNTAAKFLLLRYGFEIRKWHRIALRTDARNTGSQRAIERLGAMREGVLRRHMVMPDGYHRDTVYYSITDLDWPTVKLRLESLLTT